MLSAAITFLAAVGVLAQEGARPKIEFEFRIESGAGRWDFVAEGTTDLPDGAILRAREYVLEEVEVRGQKMLDEQRLRDRDGPIDQHVPVRDGKFRATVYSCVRRPYSLRYRVKLLYDPERQTPEAAERFRIRTEATRDLRWGDDEALRREVQAARAEIAKDLQTVMSLFRDLRARFEEWFRKPDREAYRAWYPKLRAELDVLEERNRTRFPIWAVWIEYQARLRLGGFVDTFGRLCASFEEWMASRKDESLERIQRWLEYLKLSIEETHDVLGIEEPFDTAALAASIRRYEQAVSALTDLANRKDAAAWNERSPELRRQARSMLFEMLKLLPRTSYERVLSLGELFLAYSDLLERAARGQDGEGAAQLAKAAKRHGEAVAEFRKLAGLQE